MPGLELITPPTGHVLDVEQTRAMGRLASSLTDATVEELVAAAVAYFESQTNLQLLAATWAQTNDGIPCDGKLTLWRGPVTEVTLVETLDDEDEWQEFEDWRLVASARPAYLVPAAGGEWPELVATPGNLRVTFEAGYSSAAAVPADIRRAIAQLTAHFHEFPSPVITGLSVADVPRAVQDVIDRYQFVWGF